VACAHNNNIVEFADVAISVDPVKNKHAPMSTTDCRILVACVFIINYYLLVLKLFVSVDIIGNPHRSRTDVVPVCFRRRR